LIMALASISGWLIFDYINFFVVSWVYPEGGLVNERQFQFYAFIGSSAFIPMTFQWYYLIRGLKIFENTYKNGPKIILKPKLKVVVIIISVLLMGIIPFYPEKLYSLIWLLPVLILGCTLSLLKVPSPLDNISTKGDWTWLLVFGLTFIINGLCLECWNYISCDHINGKAITENIAFWQYDLPSVMVPSLLEKTKLFEMPILGYAGYFCFSIHCWLWYVAIRKLITKDPIQNTISYNEEFI
jgi:hypothetical protein